MVLYCESCKDDLCFNATISKYVSNMESLFHSFAISIEGLQAKHDKLMKRLEKKASDATDRGSGSGERELSITLSYREYKKIKKSVYNLSRAMEIIPRTFIVSVVSEYDSFVGKIAKTMFYVKPDVLNGSDRKFSFSELSEFNTMDDARAFLIEKEIETLLRKNHKEQLEVLGKKFDVKLTEDVLGWKNFVEITERRNLFVHCDGVVSSHYLSVCGENKIDISGLCKGDVLEISPGYLVEAFRTFVVMGVMLGHVLWRKFVKEERKLADENLIEIMYDNLNKFGSSVVCDIGYFAIKCVKKFTDDVAERIVRINYAVALKMEERDAEMEDVLRGLDWSATALRFKLAVAVLRGDYEKACAIMRRIGRDGEVTKQNYEEWPLFWKFRKTEQFLKCSGELFGGGGEQVAKCLGQSG